MKMREVLHEPSENLCLEEFSQLCKNKTKPGIKVLCHSQGMLAKCKIETPASFSNVQ